MTHYACLAHKRRVVHVQNKWVNRNGDGSVCDTDWIKEGEHIFSRDFKESNLKTPTDEFVSHFLKGLQEVFDQYYLDEFHAIMGGKAIEENDLCKP